jgi:hypothetical protein
MSNEAVAKKFADRTINSRNGEVRWGSGSTVFCDPAAIYSWGRHFPMAHYVGEQDGKHVFLKNSDHYSNSTSCHQGYVSQYCRGPKASFSLLINAGIRPSTVTLASIVDYWEHYSQFVYVHNDKHYDPDDCKWTKNYKRKTYGKEFSPPKHAKFTLAKSGDYGWYEIKAAALIRKDRRYFLCGSEHGEDFVCELPKPCRTIEQAYRMLKPKQVRQAEMKGLGVLRIGEWFFVPTGIHGNMEMSNFLVMPTIKELEKEATVRALPNSEPYACRHVVRKGTIYATSVVYYSGGCSRYKTTTLKLGDEWYRCYRNTQLGVWK